MVTLSKIHFRPNPKKSLLEPQTILVAFWKPLKLEDKSLLAALEGDVMEVCLVPKNPNVKFENLKISQFRKLCYLPFWSKMILALAWKSVWVERMEPRRTLNRSFWEFHHTLWRIWHFSEISNFVQSSKRAILHFELRDRQRTRSQYLKKEKT